ncbi:MAG: hypothetical protein ABIY52_12485 [Gemmatimonadaceae bacterium]
MCYLITLCYPSSEGQTKILEDVIRIELETFDLVMLGSRAVGREDACSPAAGRELQHVDRPSARRRIRVLTVITEEQAFGDLAVG